MTTRFQTIATNTNQLDISIDSLKTAELTIWDRSGNYIDIRLTPQQVERMLIQLGSWLVEVKEAGEGD